MRGSSPVKAVDRWLTRAVDLVVVMSLLLASLVVVINVLLRYLFNSGIVGSEELVRYLIIGLTFIGSSTLILRNEHLTMDAVVNALPARLLAMVNVLASVVGIAFSVVLFVYSISVIQNLRFTTSVALQIPAYIPYLSIPLGALLTVVRFVQRMAIDAPKVLTNEDDQ